MREVIVGLLHAAQRGLHVPLASRQVRHSARQLQRLGHTLLDFGVRGGWCRRDLPLYQLRGRKEGGLHGEAPTAAQVSLAHTATMLPPYTH